MQMLSCQEYNADGITFDSLFTSKFHLLIVRRANGCKSEDPCPLAGQCISWNVTDIDVYPSTIPLGPLDVSCIPQH